MASTRTQTPDGTAKVPTSDGTCMFVFGPDVLVNIALAQSLLADSYDRVRSMDGEAAEVLRSFLSRGVNSTGTALAVAGGLRPVEPMPSADAGTAGE